MAANYSVENVRKLTYASKSAGFFSNNTKMLGVVMGVLKAKQKTEFVINELKSMSKGYYPVHVVELLEKFNLRAELKHSNGETEKKELFAADKFLRIIVPCTSENIRYSRMVKNEVRESGRFPIDKTFLGKLLIAFLSISDSTRMEYIKLKMTPSIMTAIKKCFEATFKKRNPDNVRFESVISVKISPECFVSKANDENQEFLIAVLDYYEVARALASALILQPDIMNVIQEDNYEKSQVREKMSILINYEQDTSEANIDQKRAIAEALKEVPYMVGSKNQSLENSQEVEELEAIEDLEAVE